MKANFPIGVFDSGIGGLTIARSVVDAMPNETIVYFGDTLHLPYGNKSIVAIQSYVKKIADFLLAQNVKLILIACNSATAAAYDILQDYVGNSALLVNVVDPLVKYLAENYAGRSVGLIGTKLTVNSKIYHKKISALDDKGIDFRAVATPLLVPIIEEGFFQHQLIDVVLSEYLTQSALQNIDALVLGCTHYPVIKAKIEEFYRGKVKVIDAGKIVASKVRAVLDHQNLICSASLVPRHSFYVSDHTPGFVKGTCLFFGKEVEVEELNIF